MKGRETRVFQSEVKELLQLMIHSLYSNKEIFIRELISNASDAADKLRFQALSQQNLYENDKELRLRISFDKNKKTITLNDNCIGMRREEIIENFGTIAKSGTKAFLEVLKKHDTSNNNQLLIGQFGVGFYSSFMVADKVIVRSRAAGADVNEGVYWESDGKGDYFIENINKSTRGTEITLHIRKNEEEFLNEWRIKSLIKKYSDHIPLHVELETNTKDHSSNEKKSIIWEKINTATALWNRNKSDISEEEYKDFYKNFSHDSNDPLIWSHNHVEGKQTYTSLLYIPKEITWDLWNRDHKQSLKLYVQRVFIMDDSEKFMPRYLRFVKGIIDSNDLPLNVSREIFQDSNITKNLKKALTKRVLSMLEKLSQDNSEKYCLFWKNFGLILKEGPAEDPANAKIIEKLLRFASTYNNSNEQNVSLDMYINRMQKTQEKIFYLTADSYASAKNSPHLEWINTKNIEVLLLFDRIDEWMMSYLSEYKGKTFQSINTSDQELDKFKASENILQTSDLDIQKDVKKIMEPFVKKVKKYLGERVKDVQLTYRLTNTPAIVIADPEGKITTQMAKLFSVAGKKNKEIKYIFEINPNHTLIKKITNIVDEKLFEDWIELFLEQALLSECGTLDDPNTFIQRINRLLIDQK